MNKHPINWLREAVAVSRARSTLAYQRDMSRASLRGSLRLLPLADIGWSVINE